MTYDKRLYKSGIAGLVLAALLVGMSGSTSAQEPLGTAFIYQGQLVTAAGPVNDRCDLEFSLWDAAAGGSQVGSTQTVTGVLVLDGVFTVQVDLGASAYDGEARWLQSAVRCPAGAGSYDTLSPRQPLAAAPYATYALRAAGRLERPDGGAGRAGRRR
ncbi:MAG: hypothetical protein JW850_15275 [Thermoflexales bacterium]|nr:hypothetical protein [Thermoflexales bacterium]